MYYVTIYYLKVSTSAMPVDAVVLASVVTPSGALISGGTSCNRQLNINLLVAFKKIYRNIVLKHPSYPRNRKRLWCMCTGGLHSEAQIRRHTMLFYSLWSLCTSQQKLHKEIFIKESREFFYPTFYINP